MKKRNLAIRRILNLDYYREIMKVMKLNTITILVIFILTLSFNSLCFAAITFEAEETTGSFYVDAQVYTMFNGTKDDPMGDDSSFEIGMWNTSNVGLILENGPFKAHAEFGFGFPGDLDVYTRLLYGTWTSDIGILTLGRDYTPYTWGTHEFSDDYNAFSGGGSLFDFRQTQVKFHFKNGLYFSIIEPADWGVTFAADAEIDSDVPKAAIGYDYWGKPFSWGGGIAFQTYDEESDMLMFDETVNSGFIYFHGIYNINDKMSISFNTHLGQNLSQFGIYKADHQSAVIDNGTLENTLAYGGFLEGAYSINDEVKIYTGLAYTVGDNDVWTDKDDKFGFFINSYISIGQYLTIVPEISYTDNLNDGYGNEQADEYWAGLTWQIKI